MNDRELLEAAAKAAGIEPDRLRDRYDHWDKDHAPVLIGRAWNPLTDDGDALRLAVKLQMSLDTALGQSLAIALGGRDCIEPHNSDPLAATRLAITRAAAEIGRSMK